jgi:hypothetical protein
MKFSWENGGSLQQELWICKEAGTETKRAAQQKRWQRQARFYS